MRVFGGAVGLALASSVMNNHLTSVLTSLLGTARLDEVLNSIESIALFPPQIQEQVLAAFGSGYNLQFQIMIGFGVAQVLACGLLWRRPQIKVVEDDGTRNAGVDGAVTEVTVKAKVWKGKVYDEKDMPMQGT